MPELNDPVTSAQTPGATLVQPSADLNADMSFLMDRLGFRLQQIYPSDNPAVALLTGCGMSIRLDCHSTAPAAEVELPVASLPESLSEIEQPILVAPNGMKIIGVRHSDSLTVPETRHKFEVRQLRDGDTWVIGRAGMQYRDLIPDRLGGSIIASHIRIPEGGPVPDMVHYHTVGFQLIYCYRGWVKLVYEDQGQPFVLEAGDCVTQPPAIRHRVLEASDNLEVVEIAVPAEHMTSIDHDMALPTGRHLPQRRYQGHLFCHHLRANAVWHPWRMPGFVSCDTGVDASTGGVAGVHIVRPELPLMSAPRVQHTADILFTFVLEGKANLTTDEYSSELTAGDAFVIPPGLCTRLEPLTSDLEMLEVCLPGGFETQQPDAQAG